MDEKDGLSGLTRRERECLALVAAGLRSKEIGRVLGIESGTVDVTLKRAAKRTGISDRRRLARLLREHDPELTQSIIQRLDKGEKLLVFRNIEPEVDPANPNEGDGSPAKSGLPFPTRERPWNTLPVWQRRAWAVAIAIGAAATALLLVGLSHHTLQGVPRIEEPTRG